MKKLISIELSQKDKHSNIIENVEFSIKMKKNNNLYMLFFFINKNG